jgi:dihydroxy-acid dehydratase
VPDKELAVRRAASPRVEPQVRRGFLSLFLNEVTQADEGCDFRFLHAVDELTSEPAIH